MRFHRARAALTFTRAAAFTTALTLTLVVLGIYTAATGSGLACSAQWPLCDGGVLPQSVPSFIEWFHRLVAMVAGLFIVGTAAWAWRRPGRGVRLSATAAAVLLPLQVSIGAVTVTLNGLLPWGYSAPTQAAHLVVALAIFTSLVVATLYAGGDDLPDPPLVLARRALPAALGMLLLSLPFSRVVALVPYTPAAQAAFYGASLALLATLLATTWWLARTPHRRLRHATALAAVAVVATMLLGRDLTAFTPAVRLVNAALVGLAGAVLAGTTWTLRRGAEGSGVRGVPRE